MSDLYETDIALWAARQAAALRRRAGDEIDWENVAEEIESLSRTDKREIRRRLAIICARLLKWRLQPDARSNSWRSSIDQSRDEIADIIKESPSLAAYPPLHSRMLMAGDGDRRRVRLGLPIFPRCARGRLPRCLTPTSDQSQGKRTRHERAWLRATHG